MNTIAATTAQTTSTRLGSNRFEGRFSAQFAALGLAALMTFGTLGSIHTLAVSDAPAGTLAHATVQLPQA